jgi:hypothetical protein
MSLFIIYVAGAVFVCLYMVTIFCLYKVTRYNIQIAFET